MLPEIAERVKFLKEVQIFNEFDEQALAVVADRLKEVQYPKGRQIFSEEDDPDNVYFIVQGKVRVTRFDEEVESEIELTVFDRGDAFGEDGLYFNKPRSATVTAIDDIVLYYLDEEDFSWLRATYPQIDPYLAAFARTHEITSRMKINWLGEGEFINLVSRRHPIRLIGELLVMLLIVSIDATIVTAIWVFLNDLVWLTMFVLVVGGGIGFLGLLAILWAWAEWRNDYFIVTNVRVVWRERILFRGSSRQETPLRTIQSLNIQTGNFFHRAIKVGDLIVRTFNSELRMTDVDHPERMRDLIEGFILRSRRRSQRGQLAAIRQTIRDRLGIHGDEIPPEEPESVPPVITKRYGRFAIFKTRIVENGTITYRKHWSIFVKNALLPNILFIISLITVFVIVPILFANEIGGTIYIFLIAALFTIICFFWWLYEYVDWGNDLYRITGDLIIDRDKKPFGKESFRSAPIKNIQSLGHEIPNLIGLILNVGNVYINVGDETLNFHGVHDPAVVHQDISRRMEELVARQEQEQTKQEHERMATWLEIYHDETEDQRFPWRNLNL